MTSLLVSGPSDEPGLFARRVKIVFIALPPFVRRFYYGNRRRRDGGVCDSVTSTAEPSLPPNLREASPRRPPHLGLCGGPARDDRAWGEQGQRRSPST